MDQHADPAPQNEEETASFVALRDDLFLKNVEARLHKHCHVHYFVLVRLLEDWEATDLIEVDMLNHLVVHVRVNHLQNFLEQRMDLIRLIQPIHVIHHIYLYLHRNFVDLETKIRIIEHQLELSKLVLCTSDLSRYISLDHHNENGANE